MTEKSIARCAPVRYAAWACRQMIVQAKQSALLRNTMRWTVPKLDAVKRGLMHLSLFWRRLGLYAGALRTQVMVEFERNPLAVRQGAATVMCLAAAAVAMPVISHRAAEQREGAEWAATSTAFQAQLQQSLLTAGESGAHVELTALRTNDGLRARGSAPLFESADARAMMVQAVLRGPSATADAAERAEQQVDQRQMNCLAQAVYYEARGESQRGQVAVAEVVMNRVRSPYYPNSVCGVVYQGSHRSIGCQFTFTCDGSLNHRPRGRAWERAQRVATAVMLGYTRPITQNATHYHTHAVNPIWNSGLVRTTSIGDHVFYRFPNRSERAYYQAALSRRQGAWGARRRAGELPADEVLAPEMEMEATEAVQTAPADAAIATAVDASAAPSDQPADAPADGDIAT